MAYDIPSWIKPADEVSHLAQGYQLGAQIQQANARLQQSAMESAIQHNEAEQRMAMLKQQNDQAHELERQRIQISKAYNEQQIQLHKQQLEMNAQKVQLATQAASRRYQAQRAYADAIAGGMPEAQAVMKFGPEMNMPSGAYGAAFRNLHPTPQVPPSLVKAADGSEWYQVPGPTGMTWKPKKEAMDPWERMASQQQHQFLMKEYEELSKELRDDPAKYLVGKPKLDDNQAQMVKDYNRKLNRLNTLQQQLSGEGEQAPTAEAPGTAKTGTGNSGRILKIIGPDGTEIKTLPAPAQSSGPSIPEMFSQAMNRADTVSHGNRASARAALAGLSNRFSGVSFSGENARQAWGGGPFANPVEPTETREAALAAEGEGPQPQVPKPATRPSATGGYIRSKIRGMTDSELSDMTMKLGLKAAYRNGKWVTWSGDDWTDTESISRPDVERMALAASLQNAIE